MTLRPLLVNTAYGRITIRVACAVLGIPTHTAVKVVTPVFSLRMARFMAWYWRREWLKGFSLLTKEAVGSDVWAELREMGDVVGDVVTHKNVKEGMIIIKGEKATVIVIGDLLSEVDAGLRNYITYVGNSSAKIKEMTSVAEAMTKAAIRKRKKEEEKKEEGV